MKTMVLLVALLGCSKKSDNPAADKPVADKPVEAGLAFEPMKIVSDKVIVEVEAPKGWSSAW